MHDETRKPSQAQSSQKPHDKSARSLRSPRLIVGIGASAGGLESLEVLFQNLPADTGMAFVIIQHLSPDFKSMMYELLARDTKMPIHSIEEGMPVAADHVYLLPPKKEVIVAGDCFHLSDKDPSKGLTLPIDRFFESLARERGPEAVAVILSGSGSDGSRGICDIAQAGGLVVCESQETAKFDGMPLSAQGTGLVDFVVPPSDIGALLVRHAENPRRSDRLGAPLGSPRVAPAPPLGIDGIYDLFRRAYDLDFSVYKEPTVLRRIHRRLSLSDTPTIESYAERLRHDAIELNTLYEDLLIGVTQFFRDKEPFELLESEILPSYLHRQEPTRTIRAWVAGCGTGEEAYSLAILFNEAFQKLERPVQLKIFATDVHKASLEHAGRGLYSEQSVKSVTEERLSRYFTRKSDGYQIASEIRELIVFAPHNALRDAPFTDLDFVSCRNLLIYFQPAAQTKALSLFHYGLNAGGLLFLGSSETPGEIAGEFETVHERCKVYRKWRQSRLPAEIRLPLSRSVGSNLPAAAIRGFTRQIKHPDPGLLSSYDHLLTKYMPPSLLVNERRELVDSFGGAEKLLRLQSRRPSLDVLEMIDPSLRTSLVGALQRSMKEEAVIRFAGVKIRGEAEEQSFNLTVEPFRNAATQAMQYLLKFEPVGPPQLVNSPSFEQAPDGGEVSRVQILQLENELRYAKENLQATIEELETSNEELQATNEELVASNEELQSTNEELHSVNEELYTVNAEHQRKISELAEVNQDLFHLLENTDVATIFLDCELRIRKFTSRVREIFDLLDQDVGRPIASFTHRIRLEGLSKRLEIVRDTGQPFESEVQSVEGVCYLLRLLPHIVNGAVDGVVVTLVDLSSLEDLRGRLRWMSAIVESTNDAIIGQDLAGRITSWNSGAERLYGYAAAEAVGRHVSFLLPAGREEEVGEYLAQLQRGDPIRTLETRRRHKDGREIDISLTISPVRDTHGQMIGVSKIGRDISERVRFESELRRQDRQREHFLAMLSHELRNPLAALLHATKLLRDDLCTANERGSAVAVIERQATVIQVLLDDLLDMARISQGKISLKITRLDITSLVDAIRETTRPEVVKHSAVLTFETPDGPLWVDGDAARLIQVHVNLIQNAAKYAAPGKLIAVTMRRDGMWAQVTVVDQGAGISADFLPRIFEPFVQSDETLDRAEGGLGVGLTLVRSLVELHHGRIEASSAGRGAGSTFNIRLPLVEITEPIRVEPLGRRRQDTTTATGVVPPPVPQCIVLVEDLADNREMLEALLSLDGHEVISAGDGEAGYEAIRKHRPDFALIDIGLPGIDGYEVARRVRKLARLRRTRLVALTGYGQEADVRRALDAGFDAHLVKPVLPDALARLLVGSAGLKTRTRGRRPEP